VSDAPIVIAGHAYGRRATLEVVGKTLTWRAQRGARPIAENIATTIHDVRSARALDQRWSRSGLALVALAALWTATLSLTAGAAAAAAGLGLLGWRKLRPRHVLVLEVGDRQLILRVEPASAASARELTGRIARALASGQRPNTAPTLP